MNEEKRVVIDFWDQKEFEGEMSFFKKQNKSDHLIQLYQFAETNCWRKEKKSKSKSNK
jgi:hypothetical protein